MNRASVLRAFAFGVLIVTIWEIFIGFSLFGHRGITLITFQNLSSLVAGSNPPDVETEEIENISRGLNQHIWEKPCPISLEQLCNYPIFPKAPDNKTIAESANVTAIGKVIAGIRLLGYLRPNVTGEYHFLIASNGFAELWLSADENWKNAQKIAYINSQYSRTTLNRVSLEGMKSQMSDSVSLSARKSYYFEVIYVQDTQQSDVHFIEVAWKRPEKSKFDMVAIDRRMFLPYKSDGSKAGMKIYDEDLPDVSACLRFRRKSEFLKPETRPFLDHRSVKWALKYCAYQPSYIFKSGKVPEFKRFHGVHKYTRKTSSYPFTEVNGVLRTRKISKTFVAEYPLDAKEAILVVSKYLAALKRVYPRKYKMISIKRVEKKEDPLKGNRYFLELVVKDLTDNRTYILAEYVFQNRKKNTPLCHPEGMQWNRTADVHLILTAKNLGRWVHHFIKNVENIIKETKDEHLHVVIFDFASPDIDLKQVFQRSALKNYHFITKPGNYSRTVSFTEAVESIKDPNAIVVTVDLHLDIGSQMIDDIRKHCIKGRTAYAPQIVYLDCNGSSALPKGSWYHYSYGTVATYKQDWKTFGGFSADFVNKVTWGGEDWDLIDSAVKGGLEIERKRAPWVFHYYHSKKGMWQKRNATAKPPTGRKNLKIRLPDIKTLPKSRNVQPQKEVYLRKETSPQKTAPEQKKAAAAKDIATQEKATVHKEGSVAKKVSAPKKSP